MAAIGCTSIAGRRERRFPRWRGHAPALPTACRRSDGPPALVGTDRGARIEQGFRRHARGVGLALSVAVPVMSSTPNSEVPRLRTAAERERDDVVDLQPIAGAAAPAAVRVDIAATALVAPPHLPPHGSGDVPRP